ncbi:alanine racemase [Ferruginibacter sp. SUN106]|uniref:alanine racemase n=1 Tax=Ferruginibacter sp. SUN106 TaxID=2978348 RepID=UPI003D36EC38
MWFKTEGHIEIENGKLQFAGRDLETIAKEFNTPIYVCNLKRIKDNYTRVKTTFQSYAIDGVGSKIYFAMKANGAEEILNELKTLDANIEVSSPLELERLLKLGFDSKKILFTGIGFGLHNTKTIAESGALINIDSFSQLEHFKEFAPLDISIRLNPGITLGFNERLEMSGEKVGAGKLGIHKDKIINAYKTAKGYGLNPVGLHQHIGSNWSADKLPTFFKAVEIALDVVKELKQHGIEIKQFNLGGGLGVRSSETLREFPLDEYCKGIWNLVKKSNLTFESVNIEPGRYIVADSSVLLATANMVEEKGGRNYVGLDCGFNTFNHKFLYGIEPEISNVSKFNEKEFDDYCVVGYLGESGDVFNEIKELPKTDIGDIIAIFPAGAYCASELADYHMQQLPKQLFLDKAKKEFDIFPFCKVCPKNCCYIGAVNVLPDEYKKIVERTGRTDVFKEEEGYFIINKKKGEGCPFLSKDGVTCSIQDIKPTDCKVWPLYFDQNGGVEQNTISTDCPAHKFMPYDYLRELQVKLNDIPQNLRKTFYNDTFRFGYKVEPFKIKKDDN